MNDLPEILKFVTSEIKVKPALLQKMLFEKKDHKLCRLMNYMQQQENPGDAEAIRSVYKNTRNNGRYRVLKSRLKDRLLNLIFLSDNNLSFKNLYPRAVFRLNRNILTGKFLILKDKRRLGVALLRQALNTALEMELSHEAVECCTLLCYHFAYTGNEKELAQYQKINDSQQRILQHEQKMESLFNSSVSRQVTKAGYDRQARILLKKNFEKGRILYNHCPSYKSRLMYHRIAYYYYHSRNRFSQVIRTCKSFTGYLDKNSIILQASRYGEFSLYIMESYMRLRDFDSAKAYAAKCENYYIRYTTPWLQFMEYYFLAAMRTGNITDALEIHNAITGVSAFKKLPAHQKERWRIFEAYLNFALPDELPKKQFNLFRFLNEVPLSNHDKPGYNFSILLAQIILLINISDVDKLLDLHAPFKHYFRRYIRKAEQPRCYYFGCMMLRLFKNDFNIKSHDKSTRHYLDKLRAEKSKLRYMEETEVIPFEKLWRMLKEKIEKTEYYYALDLAS